MSDLNISDTLEKSDEKTLHEIIRNSEAYLSAQLSAAIAADQRALAMAGYLATAIIVLVGAAAGLALTTEPKWLLSLVSFCVAIAMTVALHLAIRSAKPANFEFSGNLASSWLHDVANGKSFSRSLAEQCEHYDLMAKSNNQLMQKNANSLGKAIKITMGAILGGAGASLLVVLVPHLKTLVSWLWTGS